MRPTFDELFMRMAFDLSERSTCSRLQVGCLISSTDYRQILGIGYNGGPTGLGNDCLSGEPGQCGHVHAEVNAVANCIAPRAQEKYVFLTHLPCRVCASMLVNLGGVRRVSYVHSYRIADGVTLLRSADIETYQVDDIGYFRAKKTGNV